MERKPTEIEMRVADILWRAWLKTVRDQTGVHATFASALAAWPGKCQRFVDEARTVIRAMREPTDDMISVGDCVAYPQGVWERMIDAASPE